MCRAPFHADGSIYSFSTSVWLKPVAFTMSFTDSPMSSKFFAEILLQDLPHDPLRVLLHDPSGFLS